MLLPGNAITSMLHMSPSLVCAEIEELSARAGSFKPFITFTRMLKTALQGCSNTVDLDVLTLAGQMSTPSFPKADGRQAMHKSTAHPLVLCQSPRSTTASRLCTHAPSILSCL